MKKIMVYFSGLVLSFVMVSCQNWLTIQPEGEIEKTKLFETEEGFWQALNGTYSLVQDGRSPADGFMQVKEIEYLAGIWEAGNLTKESKLSNHEYKDGDVDNVLSNMFLYQYKLIAHTNTILEYLGKVDFLPEQSYSLIKGESLGMRAWAHFDLIRLWGPMPGDVDKKALYLPYVQLVSKKMNAYNTYESFMNMLISDLDSAEMLLSKYEPLLKNSCDELNLNGVVGNDRIEYHWRQGRFNYYAVLGLRARVALWMNDKETAYKYAALVRDAKNVDGSPKFKLGTESDLGEIKNDAVNKKTLSKEHLYNFIYKSYNPDADWGIGKYSMPFSNIQELYKDNTADFRYKLCWQQDDKVTTYKYRTRIDVYMPIIRLSEMYLILMEAAPLDEANLIYKEFCESRGATYQPMTEEGRQNTILTEYYKEFLAEGQIFFTCKRMGLKRMLWRDEKMSEAQYVLPLPRRETEIFK